MRLASLSLTEAEQQETQPCPYRDGVFQSQSRLELGRMLLERQERQKAKQVVQEKRATEQESRVYARDGDLVYVSGFE